MLQAWGRRSSFNVQKVVRLIGESSLAHKHIPAGGQYGVMDTSEFLDMNPHAHAPVIKDSEETGVRSRAVFSDILLHAMENPGSGATILLNAPTQTDGWIGLKPAYSPLFRLEYSGGFIEHLKPCGMPKPLKQASALAQAISNYLTRHQVNNHFLAGKS